MKIINCKLKIIKTALVVLFFVVPFSAWAYHVPGHDSIVTCGLNGPDCSLCDFLALGQSILNFTLKVVVPAVAIIFVIYGGYLYLTAGASPGNVEKAKKTLWHTLLGIVITVAAYSATSLLIGFVAKGSTYDFGFKGGVFSLQCVSSSPAIDTSGFAFKLSEPPPKVEQINNMTLSTAGGQKIGDFSVSGSVDVQNVSRLVQEGYAAAKVDGDLQRSNINLVITSGYRSVADQNRVAAEHCENPASGTCDPKPNKSVACVPKNDGSNCPHTTGQAIDVVGVKNGKACVVGDQIADSSCQQAVVSAMKRQNFCARLVDEPWHFERPCLR